MEGSPTTFHPPGVSGCAVQGAGSRSSSGWLLVVFGLTTMLLLVTRGPYQPDQNWVSLPPCWKRMWRTPGG